MRALAVVLALVLAPAWADAREIKLATLAPKGSAWAKIFDKAARDIAKATNGSLKIKWYYSGQQGDEADVVRKMTGGQLDGAALTAVGLSLIVKEVRVLELPMLFKNDKELDAVRGQLEPDFEKQFRAANYELLTWGDVGWVHYYANVELKSKAALRGAKMWLWTTDAVMSRFYKELGVNGVPLEVPNVLPSLQTGLIDACYGSPLAAVALQWYTKVKYATSIPVSYSLGAMIIRKDVFDSLSAAEQKALVAASKVMGKELLGNVRKDNERAKKAMGKAGITFTDTPAAFVGDLETAAQATAKGLVNKVYDQALYDRVIQLRDAARKK
jgi:TRAP-type C4-dicarboxylate transport system substrate-binding protein